MDQRIGERAEPAFQVSSHLAFDREGSHWATRIRHEVDALGASHQTSLSSFISLHGSNIGIPTPVEQ
jgi:hypothetical protein